MDLSHAILIRNEYTSRANPGHGATPGAYVLRYMARPDAVEPVPPLPSGEGYAAATGHVAGLAQLRRVLARMDAKGGVGMGGDGLSGVWSVSLDGPGLRALAGEIQKCYDAGATALKTVISFHGDYLAGMGAASRPDDWDARRARPRAKGAWRGRVDQVRVRRAVMHALDTLVRSGRFTDLVWCGVVQTDTQHVHVHLCMTDRRERAAKPGMLHARDRALIRQGVHAHLLSTGMAPGRPAPEATGLVAGARESRLPVWKNPLETTTRRALMAHAETRAMNQAHLAAWAQSETGTNPRHADMLLHTLARDQLARHPRWRRLQTRDPRAARHMENRVVDAYRDTLRRLDTARTARTLDPGWMDAHPLGRARARARTWLAREHDHRARAEHWQTMLDEWQDLHDAGQAGRGSRAMADHYRTERDWHRAAACKYQHLLHRCGLWEPPALARAADRLAGRAQAGARMLADPDLRSMNPRAAGMLARARHGREDGHLAATAQGRARLTRQVAAETRAARNTRRQAAALMDATGWQPEQAGSLLPARFAPRLPLDRVADVDWPDTDPAIEPAPPATGQAPAWAARRLEALAGALDYVAATPRPHRSALMDALDTDGPLAMGGDSPDTQAVRRLASLLRNPEPEPQATADRPEPAEPAPQATDTSDHQAEPGKPAPEPQATADKPEPQATADKPEPAEPASQATDQPDEPEPQDTTDQPDEPDRQDEPAEPQTPDEPAIPYTPALARTLDQTATRIIQDTRHDRHHTTPEPEPEPDFEFGW